MRDPIILAVKSEAAATDDLPAAQDLLDILLAYKENCVGMAANMTGVWKSIIAFLNESGKTPAYTVMLNPLTLKKAEQYDAAESCLSFIGALCKCRRYNIIKVRYQTTAMLTREKTFTGRTAQIIEHEIDHCNGVLI